MTYPSNYEPLLDAAEEMAISHLRERALFVFGVGLNSVAEPVFIWPSDEFATFDDAYDGLRESLERMSRTDGSGIWVVCAPVMANDSVIAVSCETKELDGSAFAVMRRCILAEDGSVSLGKRDFLQA